MRPPVFAYHRPYTRAEVDDLLSTYGSDAKVLAGGQSLIPIMNFRLAEPAALIDVNHLRDEPDAPVADGDALSFGPLVRQAAAERSTEVRDRTPLLSEAIRHVAHPAIRSRGTVCGSIAHADPAAELPAVLCALDGEVVARRAGATRTIAARHFFAGPLENTLDLGEWVQEVRVPIRRAGRGFAFEEFARRRGDYALCGVACVADSSGDDADVRLTYLGMGDIPRTVELQRIASGDAAADSFVDVVAAAGASVLDPGDDVHATAPYRLFLAARLGARAARRAVEEARRAG